MVLNRPLLRLPPRAVYLYAVVHSFCASRNRAECHYSRRRAPSRPPANRTSRPASSSAPRDPGHDDSETGGQSFWRTDLDATPAPSEGRGLAAAASRRAGGGRVFGHLLPLKRFGQKRNEGTCSEEVDHRSTRLCVPNRILGGNYRHGKLGV